MTHYFLSGIRGASLAHDHAALLQVSGLGGQRIKDWRTWLAVIVALVFILVIVLIHVMWSCCKRARCDSIQGNLEATKVRVKYDFTSNGEERKQLVAGTVAVLKQSHEDGDVLFEVEGTNDTFWISPFRFDELEVLQGTLPKAPVPGLPKPFTRQILPLRRGEFEDVPDHEELRDMPEWEASFLVEDMGVSGMAMLDLSKPSGVNGLQLIYMLPIVAIQACVLQGVILYHMALMLRPRDVEKTLPRGILFAAIYLHFINCVVSMPFCLAVLRIFHNLHRSYAHLVVAGSCFVVDAFVIPIFNLVIGALYLCTSRRVEDLILNSCAVAFISNIDNWILALNDKINGMVGSADNDLSAFKEKFIVPVPVSALRVVNWSLCVIPIVPLSFSFFIVHLGFDVMRL